MFYVIIPLFHKLFWVLFQSMRFVNNLQLIERGGQLSQLMVIAKIIHTFKNIFQQGSILTILL